MNPSNEIIIDEQEIAKFICEELHKQNLNINMEIVLKVLELEMEYMEIRGITTRENERPQ